MIDAILSVVSDYYDGKRDDKQTAEDSRRDAWLTMLDMEADERQAPARARQRLIITGIGAVVLIAIVYMFIRYKRKKQ